MKPPIKLSRRQISSFLLGLSSLIFLHPGPTFSGRVEASKEGSLAEELVNFFKEKSSAKIIGQEYLRSYPRERNVTLLLQGIFSNNSGRFVDLKHNRKLKLRAYLSRQRREDFEQGRIVEVQGWILSETEARHCALVALT